MRKCFIMINIFCLVALFSCTGQRTQDESNMPDRSGIDGESIFDDKPLKVLINSQKNNYGLYLGLPVGSGFNNILEEISKASEEKFGFPVEFISFPEGDLKNEYMIITTAAGSDIDLIFPTKACEFNATYKDFQSYFFWNEDFIELYTDLSPYLTYCPDVYDNMQQYDYVMDMVTRKDRIFALYAGVPEVSRLSLLIKNEILQEYNVRSVTSFTDLYNLMEMMAEQDEMNDRNKIVVNERMLLHYAIIKAGFYSGYDGNRNLSPYNMVCDLDDENFKPLLIEDTDIFDVLFREFGSFLEQSYFRLFPYDKQSDVKSDEQFYRSLFSEEGGNIYLLDNAFYSIYRLFSYDEYPTENPWNTYSMFMFDDNTPIVNTIDSIQLILVPYTCTQPEKAVSFVNWLYTDEKVADLLTFGSDQGKYPNYVFTREGNIFYGGRSTVYHFYNLFANFSDRLFPFNNKTMDVSKVYVDLAYKAIYPPLYRHLESIHNERYDAYQNMSMAFTQNINMQKRTEYILSAVSDLIKDPMSTTADAMKKYLDQMTDRNELQRFINECIRGIY
ncbi:MAG TPA: hypothetical protein DDZ89_20065 [Clostridiales bacterium]|nr:hypothetical protein [Clostridiales bacterium]